MTELDAEIGPLALELIDEYGKPVAYTPYGDGDYNTDTGVNTPTGEPIDLKAIVEEYSAGGIGLSNGLIENDDKKLTVAALAFVAPPTPSDTFTIDTTIYTVVRVKTTYSGELPAIYEIQVRV